jgi:hypothetical protein
VSSRQWLAPLTGVAFIVVIIIGIIVAGEPPDADQPAQEIVNHYVDNKDSVQAGVFLSAIAAALLLFFAGYLRKVLRAAEGETGTLPAVALAGATVMATAAGIDGMITFSLAETADNLEPGSVQALQALWDNDFLPFIIGAGVLLLASGISIVRHGALPRWLGWIAIVLGVLALTPIGFVAFLGGAIWILVTSVMLTMQARAATQPPPPGGPGTAAPAP